VMPWIARWFAVSLSMESRACCSRSVL
jgi:hypothetical protein